MAYLNINIPPIECYVRSNFLQNRTKFEEKQDTFFPCVIFSMTSIPHKVPLFNFLMEDGGIWWKMPIHAFSSKPDVLLDDLHQLVLWDSFSYYPSVTLFDMLIGKRMSYINRSKETLFGTYMMTFDWAAEDKNIADLSFSEVPGQHKCGHLIKLDNGNFAIQPNNRVKLYDPSYVTKPGQMVIQRFLNTHNWTVEDQNKWVLSDDDKYDYDVNLKSKK
jgi:hypothetical protein